MLVKDEDYFIKKLKDLHLLIRDKVVEQLSRASVEQLSQACQREGDTAFSIDFVSEEVLFEFCRNWSSEISFALVAEGIPDAGWKFFPEGCSLEDAEFILIVDPIDGSREIMYDKRSAFILSGIAPNKGHNTSLCDIEIAMQTEIPTSRQYLADLLFAVRGKGVNGERHNILTGEVSRFVPRPSKATSIEYGYLTISNFFPVGKELVGRLSERLLARLLADVRNPLAFEDQYISTGGQLYELMVGHHRFNADLRPLIFRAMGKVGESTPLCAHPYDLCTELIAREAGVIITDENGMPLSTPLDIRKNLCWIGYANEFIRKQVEPVLMDLISELK